MRVIVVERTSAKLVALDLRVKAGTAYETEANNGAAHFLEHLLFKGTPTRKPGEVDAAIEGIGGELAANTSLDWAQYAATVPSAGFRQTLEILADVIQRPALREEDIALERRVILDEVASSEADPVRAPLLALSQIAFAGHPYRFGLHGRPENIARLTRADIEAFWRARYVPANLTLVVVGEVKRPEVVDAARALFTFTTPGGAPSPLPDPAPLTGVKRAAPLVHDRALVTVALGFHAPPVRNWQDAVALDVLLPLLSTGNGSGGRLGEALVQKQRAALAVSASYLTQRAPGLLTLSVIGRGGDEKRIEDALLAEIHRLREDGPSDAEVAAARQSALAKTLFEEETYAGQANALAFYDMLDTYEFAVHYAERLAAVTTADLRRVIAAYLTPERYAIATVVPRRAAPPAAPGSGREAHR